MSGFGEDIDWCHRAAAAGWQARYGPESQIVHLKGQGGAHARPFLKTWGIQQAMWVCYRKHLMGRHGWPVTAAVWAGIWGKFALTVAGLTSGQALRRVRFATHTQKLSNREP